MLRWKCVICKLQHRSKPRVSQESFKNVGADVEAQGRHHLNFIDNQLIVSPDASLKKYYLHVLVDGANVGALQSLKNKLGTLSPNRRIL